MSRAQVPMTGARVRSNASRDPIPFEFEASDGARLSAVRWPAAAERAPVVVVMTPYRKERHAAAPTSRVAVLRRAGYHVVIADVRGFGGSLAPYEGFISEREIQDGVEFLEWVAKADFCDGRTATMGPSYIGMTQLLFAARQPAGLRCVIPMVAPVDTYRDWTNRGGIPSMVNWGAVTYPEAYQAETMRRGLLEYYGELIGRPDDAWHRARSSEYVLGTVGVPALCVSGWYDFFLRGTVRGFQALRAPKRLVIGPWGHNDWIPDALDDEVLRWLDFWVRGEGEDPAAAGAASLWCAGSDEWRNIEHWPAAEETAWTCWRPIAEPARAEASLSKYDVPPPAPIDLKRMMQDQMSGYRLWGESTVFDGTALEESTFFAGHAGLMLALRAENCTDLEVHARLSAVRTDGSVLALSEGRLRASHRRVDVDRSVIAPDGTVIVPWHPHEQPESLPLGTPVDISIELNPVCVQLDPGDRLRLGVTLVRADGVPVAADVTLLPGTRIFLPVR